MANNLYAATAVMLVLSLACAVWAVVAFTPASVLLTVWCLVVVAAMDRLDRQMKKFAR